MNSKDPWINLTLVLAPDHRVELARALLDALSTDKWSLIEIECKEFHMHRINTTKGVSLRKPGKIDCEVKNG